MTMPDAIAVEGWEAVRTVEPGHLREARLVAHWAAQILGGVGEALVAPEPDFSHTSLGWWNQDRAFFGQATARGSRVGLRLSDLSLIVESGDGRRTTTALAGQTTDEALGWATRELEAGEGGLASKPALPTHEMPEHDLGRGGRFPDPDPSSLEELARWYANSARLAGFVGRRTLGASPVRCWPHHFDIATLVTLDPAGSDPETARSIGFGMSPGDGSYEEPYLYVNPWPLPEPREGWGSLDGGGQWHTDGWVGAVLPASALENGATAQAEQVLAFCRSAMAADRVILGAW